MIELAKVNCPTASFEILDCRQLSKLNRIFDAVIVGFCLPYLEKEAVLDLIQSVRNLLSPGGLFYLSTIEGEYSTSRIQKSSSGDEVFVHYYDSMFLKESLIRAHFEIINTWIQPDPTQKQETTDLVILAKK
jgi:hypothetical protein